MRPKQERRPLQTKGVTLTPWIECPSLDVDFSLPLEERYRHVPDDALAKGRELLDAIMAEIPSSARVLADAVRVRTGNRFHREAVAIARRVNASWRAIMLGNLSYDLLLATYSCSTIALPTPDGPVLARNMDWPPEEIIARTSYLIRATRGPEFLFANAAWPGTMGVVTGLSSRGFAVALNAVLGPERRDVKGYPVLLHLRRVLEDARDFDEALEMIARQRLTTPGLFTLVGQRNDQRVVIERSPARHALRRARPDEPLFTTNHYRLLFQAEIPDAGQLNADTCSRYDALESFFGNHSADAKIEDDALLYAFSDPSVIQDITAQHVIMRPGLGTIRLFVPQRFLPDTAASLHFPVS